MSEDDSYHPDFPMDAPTDDELRVWMKDLIVDARRFDSLARAARNPDAVDPMSESYAPVFRKEAYKSRRHAQGISRYLSTEIDQ